MCFSVVKGEGNGQEAVPEKVLKEPSPGDGEFEPLYCTFITPVLLSQPYWQCSTLAFGLLLCLVFILPSGQRLTSRVCVPYNFFSHCRDAAWELEPGAFSELYQRYQHCDAPICLYEQGRDSFEDEG